MTRPAPIRFGPIRLGAQLACPACRHTVTGRWLEGQETSAQKCQACGHIFNATWPGFTFTPKTVIVRAEDSAHGAT